MQENEYRILVNISAHGQEKIDELLPEIKFNQNANKHYIEIRFSPKAVKRIVCATDQAQKVAKNQIPDMEIEVRNMRE